MPTDLDKSVVTKKIFSYFSNETYVVGTQKNCLNETGFLSKLRQFFSVPKNMF